MTRRKKIVFALAAIALASTVSVIGLLIVDVYLHGRYERSAGYNVWGYRGPSVAGKQPGELRVVMLGGSTAFGYGVSWEDAIPAQLERALTSASMPATVVNLGYNNEGAYSLRFTLEDYLWLDYDAAILYEGYNDVVLNPPEANRQVFRRDSPVFRWTGYLPIFPVIFKEKAAALRTGGETGAAYTDTAKTVFRPGIAARGVAGALSAAVSVGDALEQQLNAMSSAPHRVPPSESGGDCDYPWTIYCQSMAAAIDFARARGVRRDRGRPARVSAADGAPGASRSPAAAAGPHDRAPLQGGSRRALPVDARRRRSRRIRRSHSTRCISPPKATGSSPSGSPGRCERSRSVARVEVMPPKGPKNPERSFGLSVGTVLLLIAAYALWRGRITLAEGFGAAGFAAGHARLPAAVLALLPEQGVVAVCDRARLRQCAHHPDACVRPRAVPDLDGLAPDRPRSAAAPPLELARVVDVSGALPQRRAFQEDVLEDPMAKSRVLKEFWQFLMAEKKYWLLPIVIVFVLFGLLIVFSQSSAVAPFIYTLF